MGIKTAVNSRFFHSWCEASAYVLGFWWADGNILIRFRKSGARRYSKFHICSKDIDHLQMVAKLLDWKGEVKLRKREKNGRESIVGVLELSDINITNRIIALGGKQRKSFCETIIPKVPQNLIHHFVRGFFDGDGSISIKRYKSRHGGLIKNLQSSFRAGKKTGSFLEQLRDKIRENIPVGAVKISKDHAKKFSFTQYDTMLLCQWMYKDAHFFLQRKKDIWDGFDKTKLAKSRLYFSNKV